MAVEHAPPGRRGFFGARPQMGVPAALLLANGIFLAISTTLSEEQFLSWGWRVPFLLSILIAAVGLFIRLRIRETPAFEQVKEQGDQLRMPVLEVIRRHPKNLLLIVGARFAETGPFYIFTVFVLTYVSETLGMSRSTALTGVLIAAALHVFALPVFGALSDRIGRRPVYIGGAAFTALFAFPFFWLLDTREPVLIWLALVVALVVGHAAVYGPQAAFFAELFGTRVRYSALGLGYQLAVVVAGGFAPLIATALLARSGGESWSVALYLVVMGLITIVSVYFAAETFREDIAREQSEERRYATAE